VEELYECIVSKILELQSLVTQQKSDLAVLTPRFSTQISHLRGRLLHLTKLGPSLSDSTTSNRQELCNQLDRIENNLAKMHMGDRLVQEKEEEDDTHSTMQEEARVRAQDGSPPGERQDRQNTGRVSTVTVVLKGEFGVMAAQGAQVNAGVVATQVTPLGQEVKQVFTPHFYQRLPHPLRMCRQLKMRLRCSMSMKAKPK
jgi:hypothetical protein